MLQNHYMEARLILHLHLTVQWANAGFSGIYLYLVCAVFEILYTNSVENQKVFLKLKCSFEEEGVWVIPDKTEVDRV